jgi:hypothetical protein
MTRTGPGPALLFDLHTLLDELTDNEPRSFEDADGVREPNRHHLLGVGVECGEPQQHG